MTSSHVLLQLRRLGKLGVCGWRTKSAGGSLLVDGITGGAVVWADGTRFVDVGVLVVVLVARTLALQIGRVLVDVVHLGLAVVRVWRVLGDDVPGVDQTGEVAKDTEQDVDEGVCRAETSADPHRQWWEEHGDDDETDVRHAFATAAAHGGWGQI